MNDRDLQNNLRVYDRPAVAQYYAGLNYLTPCEKMLFRTYVRPGSAVLELGVGGGRTTGFLASRASRYLGIDYARSMITSCQTKFPSLDFMVADAADLSALDDAAFDAVVFAYNGLDFVLPDAARARCVAEVRRVLKPAGHFIFSSHNARALFERPSWNRQRLRHIARRSSADSEFLYRGMIAALTVGRASLALGSAISRSTRRMLRYLPTRAFWRGEGCLMDSAHGGLLTHHALPRRLISELQRENLRLERVVGDDYPRRSHPLVTDWYYYVFSKSSKK